MDKAQVRKELEVILNVVDDQLLKRITVRDETPIREGLGLDSLQLTEVLFEIEERLGAKISNQELMQLKNVGDLIALVEQKTSAPKEAT